MKKIIYIFRCILHMDYKAMLNTVSVINRKSKKNRIILFFDMVYCGFKYGAGYKDYLLNEWWTLNKAQRKTFITRGINNSIIARYNDSASYHILDNKIDFNNFFSDCLGREWIDLNVASKEEFAQFLQRVEAVVAKPIDQACGVGVEKFSGKDFDYPEGLYDKLKSMGSTLVEEYIVQHKDISKIYPHSVNTLRIVTVLDKNGEPHVLYAFIRIGNGGRVVDNINNGGMAAPIDIDTGVINNVAFDKDSCYYDVHPYTGEPIVGAVIPKWDEAVALALESAKRIPKLRYVGWDVAVTETGVTFVEGNQHPGHDILQMPPHVPDKIGMLPRYREFFDI